MSSLLRLERKQKNSSNPFRIRIFLFRSYSFGIETISTFIYSRSSLEKSYPILDQNGKSVYPFSDQNIAKTPPFGAAYTYIAYIRKYPPPVVKLLVLSYYTLRGQGWSSGESTRLPPMWPAFKLVRRRSHLWVVGPLLCSEKFSPGTPVFPSPQKPTSTNSNSTRNQVDGEPLGGCATSKSFLFIFCF